MNTHAEFFKFYVEHSNKLREVNKNIEVSYYDLYNLYKFNDKSKYNETRFDYLGWKKQSFECTVFYNQEDWNYFILAQIINFTSQHGLGKDFEIKSPISYQKFFESFPFYEEGVLEFNDYYLEIYYNENIEEIRIENQLKITLDGI